MTGLRLDLRDVWRHMRRSPAGTVVAVLTLALGVAATTTVFAVVHGALLRPIGGATLQGVFSFSQIDLQTRGIPVREVDLRRLAAAPPAGVRALAGVSGSWFLTFARVPGRADELRLQGLSGEATAVLGLQPAQGRWFGPDDDRSTGVEPVVVLSHRAAEDWFGSAPRALDQVLRLGGVRARVIGVAASDFPGLDGAMVAPDAWVPLAQLPATLSSSARAIIVERQGFPVTPLVRLDDGADAEAVARLLAEQHAGGVLPAGSHASLRPVPTVFLPDLASRRAASVMLVLSAFALMAACANLANILFSRQTARATEVAIRVSLGASRVDLVRRSAVEALTIGGLAGVPALALSAAAVWWFETTLAGSPGVWLSRPVHIPFPFNGVVFAYGMAAGLVSALLVSVLTAVHATRVNPLAVLAAGAQTATGLTVTGRRVRTALVAVQVTAAVVLLMGTGVAFERARTATDRGLAVAYDSDRLTAGRIDMRIDDVDDTRGRDLFARVQLAAARLPGVERAAIVGALPGANMPGGRPRVLLTADLLSRFPNGQRRAADADLVVASPGILDTLGLRLVRGRSLMVSDGDGAPLVAVLTASVADALWPGADAIGRRLRMGGDARDVTVVGVVEDLVRGRWNSRVETTRESVPSVRPSNAVIVPFAQHYSRHAWIVVRSSAPVAQVMPLRAAVAAVDPALPLQRVGPASQLLDWMGPTRAIVALVVALGIIAVGLTVLGVFGVVSFFVSLRTREFGVRLALGATRGRVLKMVLDHAVHIMLVGLLPGVFVAAVGSRLLESRIVQLMPNDITTWVVVPTAILALGVLAALVPAWRASRIDPQAALRQL